MRRFVLVSVLLLSVGCTASGLEVDAADRDPSTPLGASGTVRDGDVDFIDRPDGAEGFPKFAVDISLWSGEVTDLEVGCWYQNGVRHVIAGTQNPRVTRQQVEESLEGGMSVDAYLYLHWDDDISARIAEDAELLRDYPIGRYWIDVEEHPGSLQSYQLRDKISEALDACDDAGMDCGIYTAAWWWVPHMQDGDAFKDVPLWYAHYDLDPSMSTWNEQEFGGWDLPWGKQWTEVYFCGIDVDKNSMFTTSEPVAAPKDFTPTGTLSAPVGLYPDNLERIRREDVRVLVDAVPGAERYEFEIDHYVGDWRPYTTFNTTEPAYWFSPVVNNRVLRFRARALAADETSDWSTWAYFEKGTATEIPDIVSQPQDEPPADAEPDPPTEEPVDEEPAVTDPEPEPEQPEAVPNAPTGLSPGSGSSFGNGSAVALSCDAVDGATQYVFEIENWYAAQGSWVSYYQHETSSPTRSFYPVADVAYRWRVRARTGSGSTPTSAWHHFVVGDAEAP